MGGPRPGGGRSKQLEYINRLGERMMLNAEEILMAQYLDSTELRWHRNPKGFPDQDMMGNQRKFYPDFYVEDLNLYVEYKGWITEKMAHKMADATQNNPTLHLSIVVGKDKRYQSMGIPLQDLLEGRSFLGSQP